MALMTQVPSRTGLPPGERGHRLRVRLAALASFTLVASLAIYGANYYLLPLDQRPFSPKHQLLRPSGAIGLRLGYLGVALFIFIFLYALRRAVPWLGRLGTARHWMDFHALAGVTAPVVIAFHASFKFRGIAGVAFWIMLAVALSGVVGRYLYAQIPRSLSAAELTFRELREGEQQMTQELRAQSIYTESQLDRVLHVPTPEHVRQTPALIAVAQLFTLDILQRFRIAALRRCTNSAWANIYSLGGFFSSGTPEVEGIVRIVRHKAALSRRIVFLDRTHSVFHLWHVVHRPFSYAFAVLALMHIFVVIGFGF